MSHRQGWLCRHCKLQLGELVKGAVSVWAPLPLVGSERVTITCPRCGQVNVWTREPPPRSVETVAR